jgi:hypothetical protein
MAHSSPTASESGGGAETELVEPVSVSEAATAWSVNGEPPPKQDPASRLEFVCNSYSMNATAWGVVATSVGVVGAVGLGVYNFLQNRKLIYETRRLDRRKENRQELWQRFDRAEKLLKAVRAQLRNIDHQPQAEFPEIDLRELVSMTDAFDQLNEVADPDLSTLGPKGISLVKPPLYKLGSAWQRAAEAHERLPRSYLLGGSQATAEDQSRVAEWDSARKYFDDRIGMCLGYIDQNRSVWRRKGI